MKGFVNLQNKNFIGNLHYKIKKPVEIRNGNWACKIAFFLNNKLLYYSKETYANQLPSNNENFDIVYFSKDGELAIFIELVLNKLNNLVLLDIKQNNVKCYKKSLNNNPTINLVLIRQKFKWDNSDKLRLYLIEELNFKKTDLIKNKISNSLFNRWYG